MKSVLYLDDSRMSQQLLARFLEGLCEVTPAYSLEEGFSLLTTRSFDLIVADYLFPEGNIMDFIEKVRLLHSPQQLPLIVTSGSLDRPLIGQILRSGANDCLPKPFRKKQVQETILRMLEVPYVQTAEDWPIVVAVVAWQQHGVFYQYSPELDLRVEGATAEEAAQKMQALLLRKHAEGSKLGLVNHFSCYQHYLDAETPNIG